MLSMYECDAENVRTHRVHERIAGTSHVADSLQHTATHCNTLQHAATHCNTLQHYYISRYESRC